jgi:hypothetical protein|nr:MAG TPA: hypothetical protein [Caudoviricetes sp.]
MFLTIFAKKRTSKENKSFYTYLTQLKKKDSEESVTVQVKFPDDIKPNPLECPMNIEVEKKKANLQEKKVNTDGGEIVSRTLWIKDYNVSENPYEDSSLDNYDI